MLKFSEIWVIQKMDKNKSPHLITILEICNIHVNLIHIWCVLAGRFVDWKSVSMILKMLLKAAGCHSFSPYRLYLSWETSYLFFFFVSQIIFFIVDLFHLHMMLSKCSKLWQTELFKEECFCVAYTRCKQHIVRSRDIQIFRFPIFY